MDFDPDFLRNQLQQYAIQVYRDITEEAATRGHYLGRCGVHMLETATECYLVGLPLEGRELLSRAQVFLRGSLEHNEFEDPGQGIVHSALAAANWLLLGSEDAISLNRSVEWQENWFRHQRSVDPGDVQLTLLTYYVAGQFEALIARYESVGLAKPKSLSHIKGQGTMCYVLAQHRLGLDYTDEQIGQALQTFFKRSMQDWLRGHYTTVARWMKVAYWKPGDDPIATVLRCYDYLPDLEPPVYPPV